VLAEYESATNWMSEQFQLIHRNTQQAVESIVPTSEYNAFVHEFRSVLFTKSSFVMWSLLGLELSSD